MQNHAHALNGNPIGSSQTAYIVIQGGSGYSVGSATKTGNTDGRHGDTTRTKQKGVTYIVKVL